MTTERFKTWEEAGIEIGTGSSSHRKTHCPRCRHLRSPGMRNDKSLYVNVEAGLWRCYWPKCDWRGSLGWTDDWKREIREPAYIKPDVPDPDDRSLSGYAQDWFRARGLDPEFAEMYGCYTNHRYTDRETGELKSYGDKILTIPYTNQRGEVVHLKHRDLVRKKFWSSAESQLVFWGLDKLPADTDTLYITEGEYDMLAMAQCGYDAVLSVPNGASLSNNARLPYLESSEELIRGKRRIVICTDGDEAGTALSDELVRRVGPEKCWRVYWPEGCKDANDVLKAHGTRGLSATIERATPVPVEGLFTGYDLEPKLIQLYREGYDRGVGFGYPILDDYYRVKTGYMTIVTGIPGHGKSTALDMLLIRLATRHNWTFGIFSPEQQPLEWHQTQLIEQRVGEPFWDGPNARMSEETMLDANRWVSDHFAFILPPEPTIESIIAAAKTQIYRTGCKGIVLDPWNEIEHRRPAGMNAGDYISYALTMLRRFARDTDIHLWIVAHPTKMRKNDEGVEPVPDMYDISDSANWNNKADFGLVVWRDRADPDSTVDIHIKKSRRRELAQLGVVRFQYDKVTKRLAELDSYGQPDQTAR